MCFVAPAHGGRWDVISGTLLVPAALRFGRIGDRLRSCGRISARVFSMEGLRWGAGLPGLLVLAVLPLGLRVGTGAVSGGLVWRFRVLASGRPRLGSYDAAVFLGPFACA